MLEEGLTKKKLKLLNSIKQKKAEIYPRRLSLFKWNGNSTEARNKMEEEIIKYLNSENKEVDTK